MIDIRPFATLGHAKHGWLDARHHFSFADYHDPARHLYFVPSAAVRVNGVAAGARDGFAITGEDELRIESISDAELVLVDAA